MRTTLRFLVAALLCVGIAGATAFQNGSFSCNGDPNSDPTTCGFTVPTGNYWQYLPNTSAAIAGWTVAQNGINWSYEYNSTNGKGWETTVSGDSLHYSIGLQGSDPRIDPLNPIWGAGSIQQAFDTVAGTAYKLDFLFSMAPAAQASGKATVWATVRAENLTPMLFEYKLVDHAWVGKQDLDWAMGTYSWTSIGSLTTISFISNETADNKVGGILLDGLTFYEDTGIPEPGTMSMMFGAGMFGLAWLVRRKRSS